MSDESWRIRLRAAIADSGKSMRAISLAASLSPGYVHSIMEDGKEPTIDKLLAVCDAIPVSAIRILLGVDALPDDVAILRALHENPDKRQGILAILGYKPAA